MNEQADRNIRSANRHAERPRLRPVDGFVVGGDACWDSGQNMWLMLSRPGERLIDFFLESEPEHRGQDPAPCACAGVLPDGSVMIGEVDWEMDRFLSEMLDEQDAAARELV